jgi:hypothetical protein
LQPPGRRFHLQALKKRDRILELLFDLEIAELCVHKKSKNLWIMLIFNEAGWTSSRTIPSISDI